MTQLVIKRQIQLRKPPANDNFADATEMLRIGSDNTAWEKMPEVELAGATIEATEVSGSNWGVSPGYQSLWWKFTPAGATTVSIRNINSIFGASSGSGDSTGVFLDLVMAVWRGSSFGTLVEMDSTLYTADTAGPYDGTATWAATAGTVYHIQIAAGGTSGPSKNGKVVLEWKLA
jgi:hypothetical protein